MAGFASNLPNYFGGLQQSVKRFSTPGEIWNDLNGTTANNQFNSIEAAKNREWQEYMASTAHQREVEDLRNAGLNPALATGMNGGASSPSGGVSTARPGRGGAGLVKAAFDIASRAILGKFNEKVAATARRSDVYHYDVAKLSKELGKDYNEFSNAMQKQRFDDVPSDEEVDKMLDDIDRFLAARKAKG